MNKKYQKPLSRNLGDLATAEGTCNVGGGVRSPCHVGSNFYDCGTGLSDGSTDSCTYFGVGAAKSCAQFGITANLVH